MPVPSRFLYFLPTHLPECTQSLPAKSNRFIPIDKVPVNRRKEGSVAPNALCPTSVVSSLLRLSILSVPAHKRAALTALVLIGSAKGSRSPFLSLIPLRFCSWKQYGHMATVECFTKVPSVGWEGRLRLVFFLSSLPPGRTSFLATGP